MLEMERLLYLWIEDCQNRKIPISLKETQFKAKSLYEFAKSKLNDKTKEEITEKFEHSQNHSANQSN